MRWHGTFGVFFMSKYDEQFKLSVVQSPESGRQGFKSVAQRYGLDYATVRRWVAAYRQHGVSGLRKKFSHYSAEFKLSMLHPPVHPLLQSRPHQNQTKRPEPGAIPNSGLRDLASNCPTLWGQFSGAGDVLQALDDLDRLVR